MASLGKEVFRAIKDLMAKGATREDVIKLLKDKGTDPRYTRQYLSGARKMGVDVPKGTAGKPQTIQPEMRRLLGEGKSNYEIVKELGANPGTVRQYRTEFNRDLPPEAQKHSRRPKMPRPVQPKGKPGPKALPETDQARKLIDQGLTNSVIAERLGLTLPEVGRIRTRYNSSKAVGTRWSSKGYQYGLGALGSGLALASYEEDA